MLFDVGGFYKNAGYSDHLPPDRSPTFLRFVAAEMGHKIKCELSCLMRGDVYQSATLSSAVDQLVTAVEYRIGVEKQIMDLYKMMP